MAMPRSADQPCGLSPVAEATSPTSAIEVKSTNAGRKPVIVEVRQTRADSNPATPQPSDFPPPPARSAKTSDNRAGQRSSPPRHGVPRLTIQTQPPRAPPPPRSTSSSSTLVQGKGDAGQESEPTPVMRSMFPRMDSSVPAPLPQQRSERAPEQPLQRMPPPPSGPPPQHYSPSMYSEAQSPPMPPGLTISTRTNGVSVSSPLRIQELQSPGVSSQEDLLDLWSVANGQSSDEAREVYKLGVVCESLALDREAIHFTSATSAIYSLHASGGTVILTRTHPLNDQTEITICRPRLEQPTVTSPVLATIFPCLAELMAVDTASNIAVSHQLSREDSNALQTEAISRAFSNEAAQVLWDSDSSAYYLAHPSITGSTSNSTVLPIVTTANSIRISSPSSQPVVSLDLDSRTFEIHVRAVMLLSPSLYTLDTLVSAVLTLGLHLQRKSTFLGSSSIPAAQTTPQPAAAAAAAAAALPYFAPPPTKSGKGSSTSNSLLVPAHARTKPTGTQGKLSRWLSIRSGSSQPQSRSPSSVGGATANQALVPYHGHGSAPRSPALSAMTTPPVHGTPFDKDLELGIMSSSPVPRQMSTPIPSISKRGVAPELSEETTGVDLSRFQAYDLTDPELGKGTKVCLRVIYWWFGVVVWCLGVFIGVLAAGVVAAGGVLGSGGKGAKKVKKESLKNSNKREIGFGRVG